MAQTNFRDLLERTKTTLQLKCIAGAQGLSRLLHVDIFVTRAGLLLAPVETNYPPDKTILVLGRKELSYFQQLRGVQRSNSVRAMLDTSPLAIMVTRGQEVPRILINACLERTIPLFVSPLPTQRLMSELEIWIDENSRESISMHGVLVDVLGVGILIVGPSAIGKSEAALELITRGHRLVADDLIQIEKHRPKTLVGKGRPLVRHHMEIRGLGIISIEALFGPSAVRDHKVIEMVVELEEWQPQKEYDRLGIDEQHREILDVKLPLLTIPVRPGRSVSTIIEVAARDRLLKERGINTAKMFHESYDRVIENRRSGQTVE